MTVEMRDVEIRVQGKLKPINLKNINFRIDPRQRVALLCSEAAALPALVGVTVGSRPPNSGKVYRKARLSWPIPDTSFCHKHLSCATNARFIARLYEMEEARFVDRVIEMAEMGDLVGVPIAKCPKAAVSRFALSVALCVPFDTYLFTNPVVADKAAQQKFQQKVEEVGATHGLIIATTKAKVAQLHCDTAFLIDGRTTHYYDDMEAAAAHLARLTKPGRQEDEQDAEFAGEEEERVFDDF